MLPADQDAAVPRGAGGRALPEHALAGLRDAFAAEVAERLPRLLALRPEAPPDEVAQALRDAHTLGSSAVVLGEPAASRVARAIEGDLNCGEVAAVPERVRELAALLSVWTA